VKSYGVGPSAPCPREVAEPGTCICIYARPTYRVAGVVCDAPLPIVPDAYSRSWPTEVPSSRHIPFGSAGRRVV